MANFKTNIATAQDSLTISSRVEREKITGDVRWIEAVYTATGTEAATGDTISICDVPRGAIVLPEQIRIANEASMGGSDLALPLLGDAGDADRYSATSVSIHSSNAAVQSVTPNVAASVIPRYVVTEANKRIVATFSRTNAMTAGKKIVFFVPYIVP